MSKIKVSILIPVYKVPEKYLRKCIESCLKQSMQDIELVIVDDESPDNCGEICDEYASKDSRITVIHQKNKGLSGARNAAFDNSRGEFITFLDGDDYLESNACEVAYKCAKNHNAQIVMWNQFVEFPHNTEISKSFGDHDIEFKKEDCKKLQLRVLDFNGKISQVFSKLINREFLIKYHIRHIDELKQGAEGFVFNIQLFEYVESAYYIAVPLLHYTYNENSISHSSSEKNNYLVVKCFEWIKNYIKKSPNRIALDKNLYTRMLYVIVTTAITGYFNPNNKDSYKEKVRKFKKFMKEPLVDYSIRHAKKEGVSKDRKMILIFIKTHQYWALSVLGSIRRRQLANR